MQLRVDSCQYTSLGTYLLVPPFLVEVNVLPIELVEEVGVVDM